MPIYEYQCKACGFEKDVLQKLSDSVLTTCPACNEESFKKKISAAGFRLKGTGWYETDFKHGNKKPANSDKASSNGETSGKNQGKSGDASSNKTAETTQTPSSDASKTSSTGSQATKDEC